MVAKFPQQSVHPYKYPQVKSVQSVSVEILVYRKVNLLSPNAPGTGGKKEEITFNRL